MRARLRALAGAWRARRLERAALCAWCGEYRLPTELEAATGHGRRVHLDCLEVADADEVEAAAW